MRRLLWISLTLLLGCPQKLTTPEAGPDPAPSATTAPATTTAGTAATNTAVPTGAPLPPLGGGGTTNPVPLRLPDGGFAPAPEGGAFAMPTFTVPSGFTMPTALPSGFPSTLPSGFPTFPPPPAPAPSK
jgi:hypothetical protein